MVASALAAATSTMPIAVAALLVNLHDPVDLAEQIAVLDLVSKGRVSYTLGLGYRREEYDLFGVAWPGRGQEIEERIGVMQRAWTGEEFTWRGRHVKVRPTPLSQPHPMLSYGGSSLAAAKRAARLGLHFNPSTHDPALKQAYRDECAALGREPGMVIGTPRGPANVFCSEEPDRFWAEYGHHLLADAMAYWEWNDGRPTHLGEPTDDVSVLRQQGMHLVATPDELIERCRSGELRVLTLHPAIGGLPEDPSWETVRLVAETVAPALED